MDQYKYRFVQDWNHISCTAAALMNQGKSQEAEDLVLSKLQIDPENPYLLNSYGVVLQSQMKFDESVKILKRAGELMPNDHTIWFNLSNTYFRSGDMQNTLAAIDLALKAEPENHLYHSLKTSLLMKLGQKQQALKCFNIALSYFATDVTFLRSKLTLEKELMQYNKMISTLEKILEIKPDDEGAIIALCDMYSHFPLGVDMNKVFYYFHKLHQANPNDLSVLKKLCYILSADQLQPSQENLVRAHTLLMTIKQVVSSDIDFAHIAQNIALRVLDFELYDKLPKFETLLENWSKQGNIQILADQTTRVKTEQDRLCLIQALEKAEAFHIKPQLAKPSYKRKSKLRFGIISPNLTDNFVGYFIWPLFEHLNKQQFDLYCYSTVKDLNGPFNKMIRESSYVYKDFHRQELQSKDIASDNIDILLEVNAVSHHASILSERPARLQISWLDSVYALGMPPAPQSIDFAVVDPYIQPKNPSFAVHKPLIMPSTWVVWGSHHPLLWSIELGIPEDKNGYITFGTMNSVMKLTPEVIAIWAQIMMMVPNSRFLYVRPETAASTMRQNFCLEMAKHGINEDRIGFIATRDKYMDAYNKIDIALDTFPRTGGTTTCEALIMGVPVVSLVGTCMFERISFSNLSNVGLEDLCALNHEEYIKIAIKLASDKNRRLQLRKKLRQTLLDSPLGQDKKFVDDFCERLVSKL
jgi:predicted O-linked N-acetylglucosamine transferase (SPINDLY family)